MKPISSAAITSVAGATLATAAGADGVDLPSFLEGIRSRDDQARCRAWQSAATVGAPALAPLAAMLVDADMEVARAARNAMDTIVHHAGRPGAAAEAGAVEAELITVLKQESPIIRRKVIWLLSEIGGDQSVPPVAALLADAQVHDDARCALQRIPGDASMAALREALKTVPDQFKPAIAESLRRRGQDVPSHATKKLVPTLSTQVKAVPAAGK